MLSPDDLHNIEWYTRQATPPPWDFAQADSHSIDEHIDYVADLLAKTVGEHLFLVTRAHEGKAPEEHPLVVAVTGNGTTSEANAQFITMAREVIPRLLADLLQYRQLIPVLQLVYRKHARQEELIGWDELRDKVQTALCEAMGELEFVEWLEAL